ncbi:uncharacterized protein L201_000849 [Kwoniella dendrophila CBS 6074]|uniref:Pre-rRNA-processing protein TSR2 n=1 Tax=Kwoniella dendrophila CBS 6074 TaxID=1295534 RepID=A0AAX4JNH7_9TREE
MAQPLPQSQVVLLFARGVLSILDLWPALTIAVEEQWGGIESAEKKTWLASTLIDEFEQRITLLPFNGAVNPTQNIQENMVDPNGDLPLDFDEIGDLLHQIMSDEFDANLEDGSIDSVSNDLINLWKTILSSTNPNEFIENLEKKVNELKKQHGGKPKISKGQGGSESQSEGEDEDSDDEDVNMDEAPQLIDNQQPKERQEPVVDDDGFTLVQKKGGRR